MVFVHNNAPITEWKYTQLLLTAIPDPSKSNNKPQEDIE